MTGCENDDFKVFTEIFEDFLGVWPDIDASLNDLPRGEGNGQLNIIRWSQGIITVDESLIEIEDDGLLA